MSVSSAAPLPAEFDAFVRARTAALLRAAYFLTGDQHLAEDLVQSALARTHRSWSRLHASGAADAYTRKTMYHLQVSWWRRRRVAETLTDELPARAAADSDVADETALQVTLRSLLLRLPPRQRAVLVLRFFDDLTEEQTARTLGVTVGTVKSQSAKALAKLRLLAPELREFYASAADEVKPVDLRERAVASSRRLGAGRTAAMSALAAAVLAVVAAVATLGGGGDRSVPPANPTPSASLPVAPSPTRLPAPTADGSPDVGPFAGATLTLPAWTGPRASACASGRITLNQGGISEKAALPVWVMEQLESDVDGDGTRELVAAFMCSEGPESPGTQVVAFRRDGANRLATVGRVVATGPTIAMIHHIEAAPSGVVVELSREFSDGGQSSVPFQRRTFRLEGGAFKQVAGPTTWPARPEHAALALNTTDVVLRPAADGRQTGQLTVTVANTGTLGVAKLVLAMSLQPWLRPAGPGWDGCTYEDFGADGVSVICPLDGPQAGATVRADYTFVVDAVHTPLPSPSDELESPPFSARIFQRPPYTYEEPVRWEQSFLIVVG
ncbi:SigE family RNA polymerase sigma factor [Catellatospora sp. NEAU-YM18]|nr:SigE family RNA polymerase sigma factor [Catellatospora tritici]